MFRYQLAVAGRMFVEALLSLGGLLDVRHLFRTSARKPRIAFQAYAQHLAWCFAPIIDRMRQQAPGVDIDFILLPHPQFTFESVRGLRRFVRECLAVPAGNIRSFWQTLWRRYDLLICADVYARFPLRHTKTVLLKHGVGVSSRILRRHWLRKTIADFDLVLVNGEADRDLLERYGRKHYAEGKIIAAGLPYLDRLATCQESREAYFMRLGIAAGRKVALLGPSWRGLQAIQEKLPGYFDDLIAVLRSLDWDVLVKMHTCSFNKAMVQGEDWSARVRQLTDPHVHVDYDVDDVPAFLHADILVTDISSRAFDFMLLDKPVFAVVPPAVFSDELDVERIRMLRQCARLIESPTQLGCAIAEQMNGGHYANPDRRRLLQHVFANPGRATEVVVDHLLRQLNLEVLSCAD